MGAAGSGRAGLIQADAALGAELKEQDAIEKIAGACCELTSPRRSNSIVAAGPVEVIVGDPSKPLVMCRSHVTTPAAEPTETALLRRRCPDASLRCRTVMTRAELDALIEGATVDCYNDHEQVTGLYTKLDEHLALPFDTEVLGAPVTVWKIDLTIEHEIVAICRRDGHKQTIPILDLPLPDPVPDGAEWIEAYRRWRR